MAAGNGGDHRLLPLGVFREFSDWSSDSPSIRDAIGAGPPPEVQRRLAFYLSQATSIRATMGRESDVIDGEDVYLSTGLQSDGDWYWRGDLAHYVLKYNVQVPDAFIEHAASHLWSPGQLTDAQAHDCHVRLKG
jgi:hypothetical protein